MGDRYLKSELGLLRELYPIAPKAEIISHIPNHTWSALSSRARLMGLRRTMKTKGKEIQAGMRKDKHYTEEENQMLIDNYPLAMKVGLLQMFPTRSWMGLSIHAQRLGVRRATKAEREQKEMDYL